MRAFWWTSRDFLANLFRVFIAAIVEQTRRSSVTSLGLSVAIALQIFPAGPDSWPHCSGSQYRFDEMHRGVNPPPLPIGVSKYRQLGPFAMNEVFHRHLHAFTILLFRGYGRTLD